MSYDIETNSGGLWDKLTAWLKRITGNTPPKPQDKPVVKENKL